MFAFSLLAAAVLGFSFLSVAGTLTAIRAAAAPQTPRSRSSNYRLSHRNEGCDRWSVHGIDFPPLPPESLVKTREQLLLN